MVYNTRAVAEFLKNVSAKPIKGRHNNCTNFYYDLKFFVFTAYVDVPGHPEPFPYNL